MLRNTAAAAALLACSLSPGAALAMPFDAGAIVKAAHADDPVEQARVFCYNRFTGRFLHWGSCGGYVYYRPRYYYRPAYHWVCRNRWTGRIIHYGHC